MKVPTMIKMLSTIPITQISAAGNHTIAVDCFGKAWSWGGISIGDFSHFQRTLLGNLD